MTTAWIALECTALAGVLYLACFGVGWWLWRLIAQRLRSVSVWTGAPITGLAVSLVVAYYWAGHGGLDSIALWLVGGSLVADVFVMYRARHEMRVDREALRRMSWAMVVAAGTAVLFSWHHIQTFRIGRLSTGSLFLADLPNYALVGEYLGRDGLRGPGSVVGYDLGALAAKTPGSGMFMSLASSWTGRPEFEATLPAALLCLILVALAARDLGRLMLPWSDLLPAVLAIAAADVSIIVYSTAHFPLSQLLAAPGAIAFLTVIADTALQVRPRVTYGRASCAAVCFTPIVLAYPHMAVLAAPALVAIALVAAAGHGWRRRLLSGALTAAFGLGLVLVALPGAAFFTFSRLQQVDEAIGAGFALTLLTPADLLGFRSFFLANATDPNLVAQFAFEAALIAVIVALVVLWTSGKSRSRAALASAAVLGTLGSYAAVFVVRGASYESWKWVASVVPIFVVGAGSVLVSAVMVATRGTARGTRRIGFGGVGALLIVGVVTTGVFAKDGTREYVALYNGQVTTKDWSLVTEDLWSMGDGPAYQGVRAVNVEVPSHWESVWAAYFLAPRPTFLASPEGITAVPPLARWTLERRDLPFVHPPRSDVRVVNTVYRLVRERPDRVEPGALWIVGTCDGVYRFDGTRWQGVERTPATGGFRITATPESVVPQARVPLLIRSGTNAVDALLLEYLPGNQARIIAQHQVTATGVKDRRLPRQPQFSVGAPFAVMPREALELSVVFDPISGDERVQQNGAVLLHSHSQFVVPATLGQTLGGVNTRGSALADLQFNGQFAIAAAETPLCDSLKDRPRGG